jgi:hypothetical protein
MLTNTAPKLDICMAGPTRAEAIRDALMVLHADYTGVLTKQPANCPDCSGAGFVVGEKKEKGGGTDSDGVHTCRACEGGGTVYLDSFDAEKVPDALKPLITGFKTVAGQLVPEMRSKDKNADALIKMIGNGWQAEFPRDAFGADAPAEAKPLDSKEALIARYEKIAFSSDATIAMAAMREISKLRGFVDEEGENIDTKPVTAQELQRILASHMAEDPDAPPSD